ncbi:MAG TPA: tetratricopeptide repeat protein, partial [Saprospiraceae bacterium]|nr:tetratricopeptide repeat protein [Saprospiraceae bacterium]
IAVLVFMAHPVHTEVVANIKSVDEILMLLFCTLSLYSIWRYLEDNNNAWLVLAAVSYGAGLFSKESAITFLAVFPLTIWFFTDRSVGRNLSISAIMLIPAAVFLSVRQGVIGSQANKEIFSVLDNFIVEAANQGEKLASAFMMCGYYLWTLIVPHPLIHDLGYPQLKAVSFADWRAVAGFLVYVGMGVWALFNLKKKHFLSFAILFYFITFSIFSNVLIQIGTSYGERLLYAPSLGFALAMGFLFCKIFKIDDSTQIWNPNGKGALVWGVAGALLAAYSIKTYSRNPVWFDSGTLYSADIGNSPNCAKLNYHLGLELAKKGIDEEAGTVTDSTWVLKGIDTYSKAIQLYPPYHDAYGSRGLAYFRLKKYDQAFTDYQHSLEYRPGDAKVLSNMGFIYFLRGQLDKAEEVYRQSIKSDPRFVDARRNLGAVLAMKKNFPAAIEQWETALEIEPNNVTLLNYIASAYKDMGQPEKGQPYLDRAARGGK